MPATTNDEQAFEWLILDSTPESMQEIARTQVPSRDMDFCTITKEYLQRIANPTTYPQLAPIDISYMDVEEELLYPV